MCGGCVAGFGQEGSLETAGSPQCKLRGSGHIG